MRDLNRIRLRTSSFPFLCFAFSSRSLARALLGRAVAVVSVLAQVRLLFIRVWNWQPLGALSSFSAGVSGVCHLLVVVVVLVVVVASKS